jgi:hypothetical protein
MIHLFQVHLTGECSPQNTSATTRDATSFLILSAHLTSLVQSLCSLCSFPLSPICFYTTTSRTRKQFKFYASLSASEKFPYMSKQKSSLLVDFYCMLLSFPLENWSHSPYLTESSSLPTVTSLRPGA